ncbi:MAG: thioredoxin-dependent thiol peroxidase [Fibrobacterota bacterium]
MTTTTLDVGHKAPVFSLANQDGKNVSLNDFQGKWVVLYFYPKDDTPGCTKEAIDFSELLSEFTLNDAVVLGVSPDPQQSHQKFKAKHGLTVQLLSDPEHAALEQYGVWKEKNKFGKKYWGVERTTFLLDPQGVIRQVWDTVKVEGHAKQVVESLCGLK